VLVHHRLLLGVVVLVSAAILCAHVPIAAMQAKTPSAPPSIAEVVPLWSEGVPGLLPNAGPEVEADARVSNVHTPTLTAYLASETKRNGTAVIVCPGGAYERLAIDKEGTTVAAWLNSLGISAFVLKYRLKEYGHPAPLRDVLRAVRLLRSEPARWKIAPDRIGVMGFSAGGHLASSAGTLFDSPEGQTGAGLDRVSARPDFLVLVYPVISMSAPYVHVGSRNNLLGAGATQALIDRLSTDLRVTRETPPTFLVHGGTDRSVPPENSLLFYSALRRAGVPAELHLYQEGPHGVGLEPNHGPMSDWPERCAEWMAVRGLLALK
jgi:acetyl esterase/lipase